MQCFQFPSTSHSNSCLQMGLGMQELTILFQIKRILLKYLCQHCSTIALSPFQLSKCLMSLISWSTFSLWSRLSQGTTFSFLLHTLLILSYPMPLLLLLDYSNVCRLHCTRNCTDEWEKMGIAWEAKCEATDSHSKLLIGPGVIRVSLSCNPVFCPQDPISLCLGLLCFS